MYDMETYTHTLPSPGQVLSPHVNKRLYNGVGRTKRCRNKEAYVMLEVWEKLPFTLYCHDAEQLQLQN